MPFDAEEHIEHELREQVLQKLKEQRERDPSGTPSAEAVPDFFRSPEDLQPGQQERVIEIRAQDMVKFVLRYATRAGKEQHFIGDLSQCAQKLMKLCPTLDDEALFAALTSMQKLRENLQMQLKFTHRWTDQQVAEIQDFSW